MADIGALSRREVRFIGALVVSASVGEAAALAGVSERSASRYLARAEVRAELARRQAGVLAHVSARLLEAMSESVEVLRELQSDECASASARVSAARAMLESGLKLSELVALDERVTMIEARQEAMR
jgi:phage terminase small subunit